MTLYIIGLGLHDEKDITLKGLEAVKKCSAVYLENYTSVLQVPAKKLEELYGKKIILADRVLVEQKSDQILSQAKTDDVAFLVIGDPFGATTHTDLLLRAKEQGIPIKIINNASILTAVGLVGLQLYKYGKTTSIPFPEKNFEVTTPYDVIAQNQSLNLHTLLLLDIKMDQQRFMTVNQAVQALLDIEGKKKQKVFTHDTFCIGCARLGGDDFVIKAGKASDLLKADFGKAPHCLIVPARELHFLEEEALELWK